jgi:hypothetical protein
LKKTATEKNRGKEQVLSEAIQTTDRVLPKLRYPTTFRHVTLPAAFINKTEAQDVLMDLTERRTDDDPSHYVHLIGVTI